jgi:Protein of unknown function (DUF3040)
VTVLDPREKYVFDGMVNQLRADDPAFVRRLDKLVQPHHARHLMLALLFWTVAPMCVVLGGWTGLLVAVVAICYAVVLTARSKATARGTARLSWWSSSPRRRPGASL